ncbi:MAG: hypothetical protein VX642_14765 [Bdellovibrionota bacterium]|nr:hypothetical protein [Bdellovibrionota bacterium]
MKQIFFSSLIVVLFVFSLVNVATVQACQRSAAKLKRHDILYHLVLSLSQWHTREWQVGKRNQHVDMELTNEFIYPYKSFEWPQKNQTKFRFTKDNLIPIQIKLSMPPHNRKDLLVLELSSKVKNKFATKTIQEMLRRASTQHPKFKGVNLANGQLDEFGIPSPQMYRLLQELGIQAQSLLAAPEQSDYSLKYYLKLPRNKKQWFEISNFLSRLLFDKNFQMEFNPFINSLNE